MHDILKRYVNKFSVLNRFRLRVNGIMIETRRDGWDYGMGFG